MERPSCARRALPARFQNVAEAEKSGKFWNVTEPDQDDPDQAPTLWIYDEVSWWGITAADFAADLSAITSPTLNVHINSPGGDVFDGIAIYNLLRAHRAKVTVYVDSLAASIASVIAMAGDEVVISKAAKMMIHDASVAVWGNAADMREAADFLDMLSDTIAGIYADKCGGKPKSWRAIMQGEKWYGADEAVEAGLATRVEKPVVEPATDRLLRAAARWDRELFGGGHVPEPVAVIDPAPAPAPPVPAPEPEPTPAQPILAPVAVDLAAFRGAVTSVTEPPTVDVAEWRDLFAGLAVNSPAIPDRPAPVRDLGPRPAPPAPGPEPSPMGDLLRGALDLAANNRPAPTLPPKPVDELPELPPVRIDSREFRQALREARY